MRLSQELGKRKRRKRKSNLKGNCHYFINNSFSSAFCHFSVEHSERQHYELTAVAFNKRDFKTECFLCPGRPLWSFPWGVCVPCHATAPRGQDVGGDQVRCLVAQCIPSCGLETARKWWMVTDVYVYMPLHQPLTNLMLLPGVGLVCGSYMWRCSMCKRSYTLLNDPV